MPEHGVRHRNRGKKPHAKRDEGYSPHGDVATLSIQLENVGFSGHTLSALKNGRLNTLRDIAARREREMFHIQNIGKKDLREIQEVLKKYKLSFRPDEKPQANDDVKQLSREGSSKDLGFVKKRTKNKTLTLEERVAKDEKPVYGKDSYVPFKKNDKWGYRNIFGITLIEPEFDEVFDFKDGLACVEKDGFFGYIDKESKVVIPFQFDGALSFFEGYAVVTKGEKSGYIDREGRLVIDYSLDVAGPMSEGKAIAKIDDRWAFVYPDGKVEFK